MIATTFTDENTGVTTEIHQEEDTRYADPRENSNLGIMYCWHPDYELGDEQFGRGDHESMEDVVRYLWRERKALAILPLFLLDHSGQSISAGPALAKDHSTLRDLQSTDRFMGDAAGWDTTHVGFIYTTKEKVDEVGCPPEHIIEGLEGEVEEYDRWMQGEVYFIRSEDADGDDVGECVGGFIGYEYAEEEAQSMHASAIAEACDETNEAAHWAERDVVTL